MTLFGLEQQQATSDDYYTPAWVFQRLGLRFDLDVCSPPEGVPWIPADRFFTMADDGLSQEWTGRVWMNPPYSNVTPWWDRFASHGNGVALMPTAKALWLNDVWRDADAVVIPVGTSARGRGAGDMDFHRPGDTKPVRIWFPVIFAAFGDECVEALARLGTSRVAA
jgi:hypothetical protein